jgi:hypothetical protein
MPDYLSVSEARKYTGKSESTIKRMIREIANTPDHEDRGLILPSQDELAKRKAANEPYVWKIDKELLDKRYPRSAPGHEGGHAGGESSATATSHSQLIELLQSQLSGKDEQLQILAVQLDRKDTQIENLNKRMSESNVLMQTLQKRLALPPVPTNQSIEVGVADPSTSIDVGRTSPNTAQNRKKKAVWNRDMFWLVNRYFQK